MTSLKIFFDYISWNKLFGAKKDFQLNEVITFGVDVES